MPTDSSGDASGDRPSRRGYPRGRLRRLRAMQAGYFRTVNADARRLMLVTLLVCLVILGVDNVTRPLFVLRLGFGVEFFGAFNAFRALGYTSLAVPAGLLGQRIGLKNCMTLGACVTLFAFVVGSLVEYLPAPAQAPVALGTQTVSSMGFALFAVNAVPAIMSATRPHNRSKIYGVYNAARNFGGLAGLLVGGALPTLLAHGPRLSLAHTDPYRWGLLISAVIFVPALWLLVRFRPAAPPAPVTAAEGTGGGLPVLPIAMIMLYIYLSQGAFSACRSFCSAYMDMQLQLNPNAIGVLGALGELGAALTPLAVPWISRRVDRNAVLTLISLGAAVASLPLIFMENWLGAGLGRLGIMALAGIWMPLLQIQLMETAPPHRRGVAFGLMAVMQGFSYGGLSYAGGLVVARWSYARFFQLAACLTAVSAGVQWLLRDRPFMRPRHTD